MVHRLPLVVALLLPADPTIDPKIRVGPRDRVVFDHKLRKLSPPICKLEEPTAPA